MKIVLFALAIIQAVFLTLKLSLVVAWSWWIVLIPLMAYLLFLGLFALFVAKLPLKAD